MFKELPLRKKLLYLGLLWIILFFIGITAFARGQPYQYTFHGLYNEGDGTYANGTYTTVYFPNGTSHTFWVNVTGTGSSFSLDGVNDYVNVTHSATLANFTSLSVEFWMHPLSFGGGAAGWRNILYKGMGPGRGYFYISFDNTPESPLWFAVMNNAGAPTYARNYEVDSLNTWYHVVAIWSNTTMNLYVNNVAATFTTTSQGGVLNGTSDLRIAGAATDFHGYIDEVRIYANRTLTTQEIEFNYNEGYGRYTPYSQTNINLWFHADEGVGAFTADSSPSGNDGMLRNGATWNTPGHVHNIPIQMYQVVPLGFEWNVSYCNVSRYFIPTGADAEHFWLYNLDEPGTDYPITIFDYAMVFPAWLETARHVNGTQQLVERREVSIVQNEVPMVMVTDATYFLQIRGRDGTIYDFGIFIPGSSPTEFSIIQIEFSRQVQLTYRYVRAEATRPTYTQIVGNYNDTRANTNNCTFQVEYRNGTVAWTSWTSNSTHQFNWNAAQNATDYIAHFIIDHGTFGPLEFEYALYGNHTHVLSPSFTIFGTWGGAPGANILPAMIIYTIACIFSAYTIPEASIAIVIVGGVLEYLGWTNTGWTTIAYAGSLAILMALVFKRGKG